MHGPLRAFHAIRPHASPGVLAAAISVSALFASTPFLLTDVAARFHVSLGAAGLISTLQVGGFAASTFLAGRYLVPNRRFLVAAALVAGAANLLSAATDAFGVLMALRLVAGTAAGILTWIAWSDAMAESSHMADVAAAGPLTAVVASPIFGTLAAIGDDRLIFLALAAAMIPAAVLPVDLPRLAATDGARSPSRSNRVLLLALALLTGAGSSLFVFAAALGRQLVSLGPLAVSLGYSLNAGAGMVATRLRSRPGTGGPWLAVTGLAALVLAFVHHPVAFYASLAAWGFAFWMGIPAVMRGLAERSLRPTERTGDAQAAMALGRAAGPAVGGALLAGPGFDGLGLAAAAGMLTAAAMVGGVGRYRAGHPAPAPMPAG